MKSEFSYKLNSFKKKGHEILKDINFSLQPGTITSLLGVNGAGKTTLISSIISSDNLKEISIYLNSNKLEDIPFSKRPQYISHLGSSDFSKPDVNVCDFLAFSIIGEPCLNKLDEALSFWYLKDLKSARVSDLSEGEFQRVLLATTFMQESLVYLLDEPERHLDPFGLCLLEKMLIEKRKQQKMILMSSHNIGFAVSLSDYIIGLSAKGEQLFFSSCSYSCNNKLLDNLYGVRFEYLENSDGKIVPIKHTIGI